MGPPTSQNSTQARRFDASEFDIDRRSVDAARVGSENAAPDTNTMEIELSEDAPMWGAVVYAIHTLYSP